MDALKALWIFPELKKKLYSGEIIAVMYHFLDDKIFLPQNCFDWDSDEKLALCLSLQTGSSEIPL